MLDTSKKATKPTVSVQRITKVNSKSIQPIITFGTIYAFWGLKRPQKTVVRLIVLTLYLCLALQAKFDLDLNFSMGDNWEDI